MKKFINLKVFSLSFFIGLIFIYLSAGPTETILVYPTPSNYSKMEYIDKAGNCFIYNPKKVKCPPHGAKKIPIQ